MTWLEPRAVVLPLIHTPRQPHILVLLIALPTNEASLLLVKIGAEGFAVVAWRLRANMDVPRLRSSMFVEGGMTCELTKRVCCPTRIYMTTSQVSAQYRLKAQLNRSTQARRRADMSSARLWRACQGSCPSSSAGEEVSQRPRILNMLKAFSLPLCNPS